MSANGQTVDLDFKAQAPDRVLIFHGRSSSVLAHRPVCSLISLMGNAQSILDDERIYRCDHCEWWTKHRSAWLKHKREGREACSKVFADDRRRNAPSEVTLEHPNHHQHHHGADSDCGVCQDDADREDDVQLREAVTAQLQHYLDSTGEELSENAVAGLSALLVGVLGNGESWLLVLQLAVSGHRRSSSMPEGTVVLQQDQYGCCTLRHMQDAARVQQPYGDSKAASQLTNAAPGHTRAGHR